MQIENILNIEKDKVASYEVAAELMKNNHLFNNLVKRLTILANDEQKEFIISESNEINNMYLSRMNALIKNGKYRRIHELRNELLIKGNSLLNDDGEVFHMMLSVDTFYENETYKKYERFANICKEKGYKRVFDIGSAFGLQSEVFLNEGIDYVGINDSLLEFWNKDTFEYLVESYPIKIEAKETDLAVSSLCLTWNCYLYEGEKTLREQCEALARDFKACLLYMQMDKLNIVSKYFKNYEVIEGNIVYFYN